MLDRFSGELGATGVTVSLAMAPGTRLRWPGRDPRIIQTRGGLLVHLGDEGFAGTRLKPITSSQAPRRDWVAQAIAACQERGLGLRANVAMSTLGRVAQRHREMACRNVFGATSREGICLVNPDVQAFFVALLEATTERTPFDGVTLSDGFFGWGEAYGPRLLTSTPLESVDRALLSICFCESCLQSAGDAGVDAMGARRSVGVMLDASLRRGAPTRRTLATALSDSEPMRAYATWRGQALSTLWSRLAQVCRCELVIDVSGSCADAPGGAAGHDAVCGGMTFGVVDYGAVGGVMCRSAPAEREVSPVTGGSDPGRAGACPCHPEFSGTVKRRELRIPASLCTADHGPHLVALMSQAGESGVTGVQIDGGASDSVRQAIRFVRRSG